MTNTKLPRGRASVAGAAVAAALSSQSASASASSMVMPDLQSTSLAGTRQVLQVISKKDGFRRAGRAWHGTTTVPLNELSPRQLQLLQDEPMLVVLVLDVPAEDVDLLKDSDRTAESSDQSSEG